MLNRAQKHEVLDLITEAAEGPLSPSKQRRLRAYVAHELPMWADAPWEDIEYTATFMVGIWYMSGTLDAEA